MQGLDRLHDLRVQADPAVLEQARIGDFVRERVLERVFEVREETRLEDEFAGPQSRQLAMQVLLRHACDGLQEIERDVLPDHRGGLE
jgi:hypothetical protein